MPTCLIGKKCSTALGPTDGRTGENCRKAFLAKLGGDRTFKRLHINYMALFLVLTTPIPVRFSK